jgi:hypothetical protein
MLSVFIILAQVAKNDADARERSAAVSQVAEAVKAESERQTEIINRQFRAICIIIIETSGQEGLDKLDPESRERCENLADFTETGEDQSAQEQGPPQPQFPNNNSSSLSGQSTPNNANSQPELPQSPTPPEENPPLIPREICSINFLGLKLNCRQELL